MRLSLRVGCDAGGAFCLENRKSSGSGKLTGKMLTRGGRVGKAAVEE